MADPCFLGVDVGTSGVRSATSAIRALAASKIRRVAYVSCDVASFARDAAILAGAGFVSGPVTPVDQFLFSSHIEVVGGFERR